MPSPLIGVESGDCQRLVALFNTLFADRYDTCLVAGGQEPIYLPAQRPEQPHEIIFTHDYPASALHEVAHWCIAGLGRRQQIDYGYWYLPDGRDGSAQARFEAVEARPQALEWLFAETAGIHFCPSVDNLASENQDVGRFTAAIQREKADMRKRSIPSRAHIFLQALRADA